VAISASLKEALNKIKKNMELQKYKLGDAERLIMDGVVIPDVGSFDINADIFAENALSSRSRVFQQQSEAGKYKTRLVQLFREFERLSKQTHGITDI
jgi:hypothetical protein